MPATSAKSAAGDVSEDGKFLEKLKPDDLYKLDCGDGAVSEEFLRHIKALTGLQSLDLSGNRISGQTLSILEGMPNLKELSLAQDQIGD
ncbi:leucine-rich repeat domain-containing protein, partial [Acinetobacter sp. LH3_13]|uniref:leucine-rich repeat domain-containing protein n=1 Tax=Acinetobacter sp. LH3_13 TaxID=3434463 RepID=UPI003EBEA3EC